MKYLDLRKENKIGKLWTESDNVFKLAPADAFPGLEWKLAEIITADKLTDLIYSLSGLDLPARKPVQISLSSIGRLLQQRPRIDYRNYTKKRA